MTTFDLWDPEHSAITLYGSEGSLRLPDPNTFGGPIFLLRGGEAGWSEVPLDAGFADDTRGLGVADMATARRTGAAARASGDLGYHVLDVMLAMLESSVEERHIPIASTIERPAPLPHHDS